MQQDVTLVFTQTMLQALNSAVALAPYGQIAPLVQEINRQILAQQQPPQGVA